MASHCGFGSPFPDDIEPLSRCLLAVVDLLWRNVCSFLNGALSLSVGISYIFWILDTYQMCNFQVLSLYELSSHSLNSVLSWTRFQ